MSDFTNSNCSAKSIENTENVLNSISQHLSKRKGCSGVVYRVAIGMRDSEQRVCAMWSGRDCSNSIFFDSNIELCSHSGGKKHGVPAIQHVMYEHFHDIFAGSANGNQAYYKHNTLVPGIYEYRVSTSGKYRKWIKVK